jgi:hypothetical protein
MMLANLWRFLHLFFAFGFVGALTVAEWNSRAARATNDWGRRAMLWSVVRVTTQTLGVGGLVVLGILGNLLAASLALPMGSAWIGAVNGLWLVALLLLLFLSRPAVARLVATCEAAARTSTPDETAAAAGQYRATLARWRTANVLLSIFYMVMLALMVLRPLAR